jgi:hypothetical protein
VKRRKRWRLPWHWMSFADEGTCLGVVLIRARNMLEAVTLAHRLKINPGGQVLSYEMPEDYEVPDEFANRLLSKADIERFQGEARSLNDLTEEELQRAGIKS